MIAKEGFIFIFGGLCVAAGCFAFGRFTGNQLIGYPLAGLAVVFSLYCCYFFRDPDRPLPQDRSRIYSPGDGTVLSAAQEHERDGKTIRIFLSIFDVHVQRMPYWGTVREVRYQKGSFAMAMKPHARGNERNIVYIRPGDREGEIEVEQIAGFIARRIRCWVDEGDELKAGERYGMIQFGSQVAVHLPAAAEPLVKPGDKVVGGVTEIASWTKKR